MKTQETLPTIVMNDGQAGSGPELVPATDPVFAPTSVTLPGLASNQDNVLSESRQKQEGPLPIGAKFEKYLIEKLLAKGGMGAVYLVRHEILDVRFALKILFPEIASKNADFIERFIREAKLSSKIRHPNLIIVHDAGLNVETGLYYLVMDYVPNGTLRDRLAVSGRILPCGVVKIIRQISEALREAHRSGMIHRDIKPENIMFDENGDARLADLGIAKSISSEDTMLTMAAAVMGTPGYMSPEQAKDSGNIDERADIYSLGIVLYEMLAGCCPFTGNTPLEILSKVMSDEKAPPISEICPDVPPDMAALVHDMIEKKQDKRIPSVEVLLARINALDDSCDSSGDVSVPPFKCEERVSSDDRRRRRLRAVIVVVGVLVFSCVMIMLLPSGDGSKTVPISVADLSGVSSPDEKPTPPVEQSDSPAVPPPAEQLDSPAVPLPAGKPVGNSEITAALGSKSKPKAATDVLFSPICRRTSDVMRKLEAVISTNPDAIRVSLGPCAEYRDMSLDSFKHMAVKVIERLKRTGIRFVMMPDGGNYGTIIQDLARQYSCDIQ